MDEHPLVEALGIGALHRALNALEGRTLVVPVQASDRAREPTEAEIDAIHQGLLRKQRGGSLGLNE